MSDLPSINGLPQIGGRDTPALRNVFGGASAKLSDVIWELRRALPQGPQFCSVLRGHLEPYACTLAVMDSANSLPENIRALASGLRSVAWCLEDAANDCARELREERGEVQA